MAAVEKPPRHVRAHSSQTNHADLHSAFLLRNRFSDSYLVWCPGSSINRMLKNPPFTLRQAQGERRRACNCWRFSVRAEPVEARKRLFQQPVKKSELHSPSFPRRRESSF